MDKTEEIPLVPTTSQLPPPPEATALEHMQVIMLLYLGFFFVAWLLAFAYLATRWMIGYP